MPQAEHHDVIGLGTGEYQGQVLVLLVVAVEERQLSGSVGGVVHGVEIEGPRQRRFGERGDELIDEDVAESEQGRNVDLVLEAGQRRLTGQVGVVGRAIGDEFEDRIGAEGVVVVLVFVAGEDAEDTHADHVEEGVFDASGIAGIVECVGERYAEADTVIELSQGEQTGIGGERGVGKLDLDR